ncbi:MAG: glycosyltransferase family 2 protein [Pseudomonadota bacterium]
MTTWGIASTILAPAEQILRFAAYHLELGAHRVHIFLDNGNADAYRALKAHPKIRVRVCDDAHWRKLGGPRPKKHQVRQSVNATQAYCRSADVDWLIHMDVDEFLVPQQRLDKRLSAAPSTTQYLRCRPTEALAGGDGTAFKAFISPGPNRQRLVETLYPTFGRHLRGGFMSHVAGKIFLRTGLPDIELRIHNAFQHGETLGDGTEMPDCDVAHVHAASWDAWRAAFEFRLQSGSYRPDIKPARGEHGVRLHDLLTGIYTDAGERGLRAFFDEVIGDSAALRSTLQEHGLLRLIPLDTDAPLSRHFPDYSPV